VETFLPIPSTINAVLHLLSGSKLLECLCQSQLCEQIAGQTGGGVRQPWPAGPDSNTEESSVPHKRPRPRPRPASAALEPHRDLCSRDSEEVGSPCRRRRRPSPSMQQSPGQRRTAARRRRPRSVTETGVTRETQRHHRVRRPRHSRVISLNVNTQTVTSERMNPLYLNILIHTGFVRSWKTWKSHGIYKNVYFQVWKKSSKKEM